MACSFSRFSPQRRVARALSSVPLRWLACSGAALALGCSDGGQTGDEHSGSLRELKGTAQRLSASGSLPNSASADGWDFGWRFYAEEASPEANTFFSPYSISVASSMLIAGAAGETKAEMQQALSFSSDGDAFHQARNSVAQALATRNRPATEELNAQTLRVTNDFWMDPAFRPESSFLNTLSAYYGASTFLAPFSTDPEAARVAINGKVATDTEQLIPDLLPPDSITRDVAFVLTNALYFKARWQSEFPKSSTADEPFQAQSGASVDVPMMHTQLSAGHFSGDAYEAVALAYQQNELELIAIMPAEGTFDAFVEGLTADAVTRIQGEIERSYLDLRFPKLEIKAKVPLKERLQALGMQGAFEPGADFSALAPNIYISDAFHDATISIDEEGTVAAAATAFVGVAVSAPPTPIPVVFDHPFVFFVRDIQTNALLFVGHYANP
jgi:serpin B